MIKIVALAGTNGSGKDTIGEMLAERQGFLFVSATDMLRDEAKHRGEEPNRETLRTISAEWRRQYGLGVLIDKALERLEKQPKNYKGLAVASLRNPGENDRVHELDGIVVWVQADPEVGYARIQAGTDIRGRKAEDQKTFEEFLAEQQAEMQHSGDMATLSIGDVKAKADIFLENNDNNIEVFKNQAEKSLQSYLSS